MILKFALLFLLYFRTQCKIKLFIKYSSLWPKGKEISYFIELKLPKSHAVSGMPSLSRCARNADFNCTRLILEGTSKSLSFSIV